MSDNIRNKRRFVDSHLHIWDTTVNPAWYDFPVPDDDFGRRLGWRVPLRPIWMPEHHRQVWSNAEVVKIVHVTGISHHRYGVDETRWLGEVAKREGFPDAVIGTADIDKPLAEIARDFDENMKNPMYRGIRLQQGVDYQSEHGKGVLSLLAERGLVYDVIAHPMGGISAAARAARRHPTLPFIMEHTGWPQVTQDDKAYFQSWKDEMREFAELETTTVKLSGLGMTYHRTRPDDFLPYFEYCLDLFGPKRCMFGSNFPVDAMYGTFGALFEVFEAAAASLSPEDQAYVFEKTAERVYRI